MFKSFLEYLTMIYGLWTQNGALNSGPVFSAFAGGVIQSGNKVVYNSSNCDVEVIWSVLWKGRMGPNKLIWERARKIKKPVVVLEVGMFDRGNTWKIGVNGIGEYSRFYPRNNDNKRAKILNIPSPVWTTGDHILICCQNAKSELWEGKPEPKVWLQNTIAEIKKYSDRPIIIRPHPRSPLSYGGLRESGVTIQQLHRQRDGGFNINFNRVHATINANSNPSVESVLAGVPVFCDSSSLASQVGNLSLEKIETPLTPDTRQWINDLAYTEFSIDEISDGWPIKHLTTHIKSVILS
jgi:hypothetical protein